jgi:hypothetical protein
MTAGKIVGFTPGPWTIEDPFDFEVSIVANGDKGPAEWTFIAACTLPDEDDHGITSREAHANARLIAAAPTMLATIEQQAATITSLTAEVGRLKKALDEARTTISVASSVLYSAEAFQTSNLCDDTIDTIDAALAAIQPTDTE